MTLALPNPMMLKPEDFDRPLKRKEALVPYYWTVEELAEELGVSVRKVQLLYSCKYLEEDSFQDSYQRLYRLASFCSVMLQTRKLTFQVLSRYLQL